MPVMDFDSLHPTQKPPIFDETPKDQPKPRTPAWSSTNRRDSLVDKLTMIAKLAGTSAVVCCLLVQCMYDIQ